MHEVVIVEAVRTPVGRRNGSLAALHATELAAVPLRALVERTGVDPRVVGQVVGGCVQQVGMQSANVIRNAWLTAGLPLAVPATTVNVQCGSSQQATTLAHALVGSGLVDVAVACGVESMSAVPMGSSVPRDPDVGMPRAGSYEQRYEVTTQFQGADRIAREFGISRFDTEELGKRSQDLAARAWAEGRFDRQIVPVALAGGAALTHDEGLRDTSLDALAGLRTNLPEPDAVHTAGTSSQIADGAAALLLHDPGARGRARAASPGPDRRLGARRERSGAHAHGTDPRDPGAAATNRSPPRRHRRVRGQRGLRLRGPGVGQGGGRRPRSHEPQRRRDRVGHPLGATGCILLTKALWELERTGGRYALVTMCCGGGLGTGTIIERLG